MIFNGKRLVLDEQHFLLCLPGKFLGLPPESAPDSIWARFHSNNTLVGWVICDGIAIADRNLLGDISWNSLRDQGLFEDKVDIVIEPMSQLSICHALIRYRKEDGAEYALHQPLSKS